MAEEIPFLFEWKFKGEPAFEAIHLLESGSFLELRDVATEDFEEVTIRRAKRFDPSCQAAE